MKIDHLREIAMLPFGFSCNAFLIYGERKGSKGKYGPFCTHGIDVLKARSPIAFKVENGSGLKVFTRRQVFEKTLAELSKVESVYTLTPPLYKFEQHRTPQSKHIVLIAGTKKDLEMKYLVPTITQGSVNKGYMIENNPIEDNATNQERARQSKSDIKTPNFIKLSQRAMKAEFKDELIFNDKGAKLKKKYRMQDPDKSSYTKTSNSGGGTQCYHWAKNRLLTHRERARNRTISGPFKFMGSMESVRRKIEMVVSREIPGILCQAILTSIYPLGYDKLLSILAFRLDRNVPTLTANLMLKD